MTSLDLDWLDERIQAACGRRRILIGIDGPGASGKSTLADLLRSRLADAAVVHVDDFYLPSAERTSRTGQTGELFDLPRLEREVLRPGSGGRAFAYSRYDWGTDALADRVDVSAGSPIVVEGVYSLSRNFRRYYSFAIYCQASHHVRIARGVERVAWSATASRCALPGRRSG